MDETSQSATGRLRDRVAIVTGGGSGIGEAASRAFAAEGATVAVLDINAEAAEEVAASLPGAAFGLGVDVSQSAQVNRVVDEVVARAGRLDILMHAAGVDDTAVKERIAQQAAAGVPLNITADLSDQAWHRIIAVNLDGVFFMARAVLRHMLPAGAGSIIVVGSTSGINGYRGHAHYSASKGGVHALCRSVAAEVAASGIRVNSIAPGATDTPMRRRKTVTSSGQDTTTVSALGRPGRPEEIAKAALFLASDDSSFVIGETMIVDGGRLRV